MLDLKPLPKKLLKVDQLCWAVGNKTILNDLTFVVEQGEFVGIIGPNGAGKSTLLKCLYRKYKADSGHIEFDGKAIENYSRNNLAQQIAVVLQESDSYFDLTVIDVARMGLTPNKSLLSFDTDDDTESIYSSLQNVDLLAQSNQSFNSLSGGEKQRVMIARAMLQSPRLMLMDEPTSHLDIKHQIEILALAKKLDKTVIVTLHDLNLASAFCDRIILLDKGEIVAQGTPEKVLTEENIQRVFQVSPLIKTDHLNQKVHISYDLSGIINEQ